MPHNKYEKPKYPPVDLIKAVILERKMEMKLEYTDIAKSVNVAPEYLRKLMTTKRTEDWNPDIRNAVCRRLGINIKTTLDMVENNGNSVRLN